MNKELNKKIKISIFVLVILWCFSIYQNALELKKEYEWNFAGETQFFILDGKLHVWTGKSLFIYPENKKREEIIKMGKGEGPGDCLLVNRIISYQGQYILWDRRLMRMSFFSKNGKLISTEKFKLPILSTFIGKVKGSYIFKWHTFSGVKNRRYINEQVGLVKGEKKKILFKVPGRWNKGRNLNYDRPFLLDSFANNKLYYAKNQEYKIYLMDLSENDPVSSLFILREKKPIKWNQGYADLQWDILKKPPRIPEYNYPEFVPPLFAIAASGELLVAVTNEKIAKRKAVIDIFQKKKYIGSAVIPILHQQYLIFPAFQNFPAEVHLHNNSLYTFHYFTDLEIYKIIKWEIIP